MTRGGPTKVNECGMFDPEFGHRTWTPFRAATAVPLDEVVRQDRPGVKITYRGNLSETGSISRCGGREKDEKRPGIKTRGE